MTTILISRASDTPAQYLLPITANTMRLLPLALASIPLAASTPLGRLGGRYVNNTLTENVNIDLQVNKATSEATIEIWNQDRSQVLAQSCSSSTSPGNLYLDNGHFSKSPIAVQINTDGRGNITIGDKSFKIHSNPEISGGIECNSIISDGETIVSCLAPVPNELVRLSKASRLTMQDCFPNGGAPKLAEVMRAAHEERKVTPYAETLREMRVAAKMIAGGGNNKTVTDMAKRQYNPCSIWSANTVLEGNGDPHQTPKHIQLSDPIDCGNGGCSVAHTAVKSMSIGFSVGAELASWISGGFSVEQSVETGSAYECSGDHEWVAVWKIVPRTSYWVRNALFNSCTGSQPVGSPFLLTSPNSGTKDRSFYCVRGKKYVRNLGDSYNIEPGTPGKP
ncbi:hypothetical protein QBC45DRAFT_421414 [Copromyces sp. CBS 386.78]|nr:hypothetical protein QBC45DRAFT_421414 [Copromyces sp. CBS 386.78]